MIAFSVADTGIGITPEQQRDLRGLRPGRRLDGAPVWRHRPRPFDQPRARVAAGWRVTLSSSPGEGSTFTVYLPESLEDHVNGGRAAAPSTPAWQRAPSPDELRSAKNGAAPELAQPLANGDVPSASNGDTAAAGNGDTAARANGDAAATAPGISSVPSPATECTHQLGSTPSNGRLDAAGISAPAAPALKPMLPLEHSAGARLEGMKVLVVDDDFHNIFALAALLKRVQVKVISAESGQHGVTLLEQTSDINLVLVDVMMPSMDGYATMRAMRELPSGGAIPLIAFTAKVEPGERQRCIDAGASAYVPKPVNTADLLRMLGEWLPAPGDTPQSPGIDGA